MCNFKSLRISKQIEILQLLGWKHAAWAIPILSNVQRKACKDYTIILWRELKASKALTRLIQWRLIAFVSCRAMDPWVWMLRWRKSSWRDFHALKWSRIKLVRKTTRGWRPWSSRKCVWKATTSWMDEFSSFLSTWVVVQCDVNARCIQ